MVFAGGGPLDFSGEQSDSPQVTTALKLFVVKTIPPDHRIIFSLTHPV